MTDRLHRFSALAKYILPKFIWLSCRKLLTALITPIRFSLHTGHFRSSLRAAAVDRRGEPIPWYTYPAIDFLAAQDFTGRSVLEFGGGHSTLWWARRARSVVTLESDAAWFAQLEKRAPANASLSLVVDDFDPSVIEQGRLFDVVIVDGLNRLKAAQKAIEVVNSDGVIIVDNSHGERDVEDPESPVIELLRSNGFGRIDFYGYAPGVVDADCTSLCFRPNSFIVSGVNRVVRHKVPLG